MATTYTWTLTSASGPTDWNTPSAWNPQTTPGNFIDLGITNGKNAVVDLTALGTYTVELSETDGILNITGASSGFDLNDSGAVLLLDRNTQMGVVGPTTLQAGTIELSVSTQLLLNTVTLSGAVIEGQGELEADTTTSTWTFNAGSIVANGGDLSFGTSEGASDPLTAATGSEAPTFAIDAGSTLEIEVTGTVGTTAGQASITFNAATGTLQVDGTNDLITNHFFNSSGTSLATISGMEVNTTGTAFAGDVIDLYSYGVASSASIITSNGVSTLQVVTSTNTYDILTNGNYSADTLNWTSDNSPDGGTILEIVCYAAGTRLLTPDGERAVEDLAPGDRITTLKGKRRISQPIKWIGVRRIDLTRHPRPAAAAPIRIRRNAFGKNLPRRDLLLSPEHALFIDGGLVPARLLVNGMTIVQELETRSITYYHVELDRHAILLAENLPAESYLDTGNRAVFSNAGLALILHPEFTINAGLKCWETDACAPLVVSQQAVKPIWDRLAARADALGFQPPQPPACTDDPALHLVANGRKIRALLAQDNRYVFAVPPATGPVRLVSRAEAPCRFTPYIDDPRLLGVAVRRILLRNHAGVTEIPVDHPALRAGWHQVEGHGSAIFRWTNGNAVLPLLDPAAPAMLEIELAGTGRYIAAQTPAERLAA